MTAVKSQDMALQNQSESKAIPELSDEEIWNEAKEWALCELILSCDSIVNGAKLYREQLKQRQ